VYFQCNMCFFATFIKLGKTHRVEEVVIFKWICLLDCLTCCVMKRRIRFQSLINLVPNVAALNVVDVKLG